MNTYYFLILLVNFRRNKICEVKAAKSNTAYQGILEMIGRETLVVRVKEECATMWLVI